MAEVFTPLTTANLSNQQSITAAIDANFASIQSLFLDVLSRSAIAPNQMQAALDMNSKRIINLTAPVNLTDPVRLQDVTTPTQISILTVASNVNANTVYAGPNSGGQGFPSFRGLVAADLTGLVSPPCNTLGSFPIGLGPNAQCSTSANSTAVLNGGPLTINPTTGTSTQGLVLNQTGPTGVVTGPLALNTLTITDASAASGNTLDTLGWLAGQSYGMRVVYKSQGNSLHNGLTVSAVATGDAASVTALSSAVYINTALGGSFTGQIYAALSFVNVGASGIVPYAIGNESEVLGASGSSMTRRVAYSANTQGAVQGSLVDAAFMVSGAADLYGAPIPFKDLMLISSNFYAANTTPISTNFFRSDAAISVTNFANLSNVTITGNILNFPNLAIAGNGAAVFGAGSGLLSTAGTIIATCPSCGSALIFPSANGAAGFDGLQVQDSTGNNLAFIGVLEASNTAVRFGQTSGNYAEVVSLGTNNLGLLLGTFTNVPLIVGTNNTKQFSITGAGVSTFFGGELDVQCTSCGNTQLLSSQNTTTGTEGLTTSTSTGANNLLVHTHEPNYAASFFGQVAGGWSLVATNGANSNGLLIGTLTNTPINIGTNNTAWLNLSGAGAFLFTGTITNTINQNTTTAITVNNNSTGTSAAGSIAFANNGANNASFGLTGTNYTAITGLQNRTFIFNSTSGSGIVLYNQGANPLVIYANSSQVGNLSSGGVFWASTGYQINGASATSGHYLRGNGTNYVDGTIASGDLPQALVLNTSLTVPIVYGGSSAGSTLTLNGTSNGAPSNAYLILQAGGIGFVGIDTSTPKTYLDLNINNTSSALVSGQSLQRWQSTDGNNSAWEIVSYQNGSGAVGNFLRGAVANGTAASPTATLNAANLFNLQGSGYNSGFQPSASFTITTAEAWSAGHQGSMFVWNNTPVASTTVAEAMRLQASGGLSIGTTTDPGIGSLQLNQQIFMPNITTSSAAQNGTVCWTSGTGKFTADTTVGCLTSIGAAKNIVAPLNSEDALKMVSDMRPVSFRYKDGYGDGGRDEQFGLIADEVAEIDERMVGRDEDGTLRGVRYMELTSVLVGAIQALQEEIRQLKNAH